MRNSIFKLKGTIFFSANLVLIVLFQSVCMSGQPSFQGLGDLAGGTYNSSAYDISADGSVVVGKSESALGTQAFKWKNGVMTGLGDLPGGVYASTAWGVSADGSVIVGSSGCSWGSISGVGAFKWTQSGGMVSLGGLGGTNVPGATAYGVSSDGSVIVGWSDGPSPQGGAGMQAFRWTASGGMQPLGFLPGGNGQYYYSIGYAVSGDGSKIVGVDNSTSASYSPVKWDNNGNIVKMAGNGQTAYAYGISANGAVVVGESYYGNAAIWTNGGQMEVLGKMSGTQYVSAYDASGDGSIVVGGKWDWAYGTGDGGAFIWDRMHGMRSMQTVLTNYGVNLTGWTLTAARGVSYDGLTIVGYGINPQGVTEGWIATIPEPGTLLLLGFGAALISKKKASNKS